jgi:hypothetical protein
MPPIEVTLESKTKWWATSKTMLLNLVTVLAMIAATLIQVFEPAMPMLSTVLPGPVTTVLVSLLAMSNMVLRCVSTAGIQWKKPGAEGAPSGPTPHAPGA